jgi:D-sedoheptulose 7-phosphate isomerase
MQDKNKVLDSIVSAKRIYLIGNGGSWANAVHAQNDFLMVGLKAHTLDIASLTRTANDHGYDYVFSDWIETVGERGDLLVALSGSGKSPNILNAIYAAKAKGMTTLGVFGAYNGHSDAPCDFLIQRGMTMQIAETAQIEWAHEIMLSLRK